MNIVPFQFDASEIRVVMDESGEPLFFAQDLAMILGYSGSSALNKIIDDDDKTMQTFLYGTTYKKQSLVNESGLYQAIFGSTKPEAKRFKKWVTAEVLPAIRKNGSYSVASSPHTRELEMLAFVLKDLNVSPSCRVASYKKAFDVLAPSVAPALPAYTIDAPMIATNGEPTSSMATKSLTTLLKEHQMPVTARRVNELLESYGYIYTNTRTDSKGKVKEFKTITDKGLAFGKNITSASSPRETQPHWYVDRFRVLISKIGL